jgi:hypothetical protein
MKKSRKTTDDKAQRTANKKFMPAWGDQKHAQKKINHRYDQF